jgi:hypothetical protein
MLPYRPRSVAPVGWSLLLEGYLGASEPVSRRLWGVYEPRCSLRTRYLLENVLDATPEALLLALPPQRLIALCLEVSPEQHGRVRDPEIVQLEGRLVRCVRHEERKPWYEQCMQ